jgi:hypothetical protein
MADARQSIEGIVGRLMPRDVLADTVEGEFVAACIDGLVTGTVHLNPTATRTDLTTHAALDVLEREALKMA